MTQEPLSATIKSKFDLGYIVGMNIPKEKMLDPEIVKALMKYSYTYFQDWFSMTWLCSHIRFVEIGVAKEIKAEDFLLYVLLRDPTSPSYDVEDWLGNMELVVTDEQSIMNHLQRAARDFDEAIKDKHLDFDGLVLPWSFNKIESVEWAFSLKEKQVAGDQKLLTNKHNAGPTDITIWSERDKIYFLETHNES